MREKALYFYRLSVYLTLLICLQGCATYHHTFGYKAKDLSKLHAGMSRSEVDKYLGTPLNVNTENRFTTANYLFDRGWVSNLQKLENPQLHAVWAVPLMAFVDTATVGMMSVDWGDCRELCRMWRLEVIYDNKNKLVGAKESILEDWEVGKCLSGSYASECKKMRSSPINSTLPESLINTPWTIDEDEPGFMD